VDTQASGNNRKITAFLGGLDLCDGRYDTPEHTLFLDLDTVFKDDFHQPTFPVSDWFFDWLLTALFLRC
jgi:phospholipase D1/2